MQSKSEGIAGSGATINTPEVLANPKHTGCFRPHDRDLGRPAWHDGLKGGTGGGNSPAGKVSEAAPDKESCKDLLLSSVLGSVQDRLRYCPVLPYLPTCISRSFTRKSLQSTSKTAPNVNSCLLGLIQSVWKFYFYKPMWICVYLWEIISVLFCICFETFCSDKADSKLPEHWVNSTLFNVANESPFEKVN